MALLPTDNFEVHKDEKIFLFCFTYILIVNLVQRCCDLRVKHHRFLSKPTRDSASVLMADSLSLIKFTKTALFNRYFVHRI